MILLVVVEVEGEPECIACPCGYICVYVSVNSFFESLPQCLEGVLSDPLESAVMSNSHKFCIRMCCLRT